MFSINVTTDPGRFICAAIAFGFGLITAFVYAFKNAYSRNMAITLVVLPVIVDVVLSLINGVVGVGIAIAGTFGLVRFRSTPGSSRDICYIFLSMASGLMCSTGAVGYGGIILLSVLAVLFAFKFLPMNNGGSRERNVKITVAESMNYSTAFEEIFKIYTTRYDLVKVKTTNMGSTFDLTYSVSLRNVKQEKELIDSLRERNGNLPVMSSKVVANDEF